MESLREQAKRLKEDKKYSEAINIYTQLYTPESDKWIAWEYSYCLKQLNMIDQAIIVCKKTYSNDKSFKYNNDLLAWLLYEKYFKHLKEEYTSDEIKKIYDIATFITQIVEQSGTSPYELILTKAIKIIKVNAKNAVKILSLLDKLEVDKLSGKANTYTKNGRESEYQSNKEMYYSVKSKALFFCESYELCLDCCSEALSKIEKFHHDNNIWIESRIALCHGKLGNTIEAINILKELSNKKSHWSILANIGDLYIDIGDMQNAIFYMSMAALTSDPPKMKVSLYQKIALLLNPTGEKRIAYHHMLLSKSNREKEQWTIPLDMQNFLNSYEKDNPAEVVNLKILKDFWVSTIITTLGEKHGIVTNINPSRKIGFISCEKNSYFFKMASAIDNHIKQGDKVSFCLIDSFDLKKNKPSKAAAYIKIDK